MSPWTECPKRGIPAQKKDEESHAPENSEHDGFWIAFTGKSLAKGFPLGLSSGFIGSVTVLVSVGDRLRQVVDH